MWGIRTGGRKVSREDKWGHSHRIHPPYLYLLPQLRTTTLESRPINFSFWSFLISPLHDEIKTLFLLDPNLGDIKPIMKYTLTPLGWVPQKQTLQPRFDAGLLKLFLTAMPRNEWEKLDSAKRDVKVVCGCIQVSASLTWALKLGWPFRDVLNWSKGTGFWDFFINYHWVWAAPGEGA